MQIFTSTSEGVEPEVRDCQGASQYVNMRFTVGAGVMVEKLVVIGEGVSSVNPHSVEKVICWSQSVTVILDARPVSVVAQTVVCNGANIVWQLPVPSEKVV